MDTTLDLFKFNDSSLHKKRFGQVRRDKATENQKLKLQLCETFLYL